VKQGDLLKSFYNKLVEIIGDDLPNKIYENPPDQYVLPLVKYFIIADVDTPILGGFRINNTYIQVSFFAKKSEGIPIIRTISDKLVEEIDGSKLDNGLIVSVTNKGVTTISDVKDETIQIITEFKI